MNDYLGKYCEVYFNLHKRLFSVRHKGIVVAHARNVKVIDAKFVVQPAGRAKVLREKKKNVHAFVEGFVVDAREADHFVDGEKTDQDIENGLSDWNESVYYNPYKCDGFTNTNTEQIATGAKFAALWDGEKTIDVFQAKYQKV